MPPQKPLPPGQREIDKFPRFGLSPYARRFKTEFDPLSLVISGDVQDNLTITATELTALPRIRQQSDFHCVTTWTKRGLHWSGFRFRDFFQQIVQPQAMPAKDVKLVIFRSQDGYRASLPLADALAEDVLLADTLDNMPLTATHGAPLRLIAPAHYGYKNAKHIKAIEFWEDDSKFRGPALGFMIHPRGRVAFEERGTGVPGWLLRYLYRPLIKPTIRQFERAEKEKIAESKH